MGTPTAAALYCRLSYAPDGSPEKVERQEADCRELATRLGWRIADVYSDNSKSAWSRNRKRPAWDRMLTDIEAGRLDSVIVYHGDRLVRQPWDLELLLKLADDRQLRLASPSGTRDLQSEDDRFILRIEAAQACRASADTSRRVKRGWQARAERGQSIGGGKRPFGYGVPTGKLGRTGQPLYDTDVQRPEEAEVLAEAIDRIFAGESLGSVLTWMNTVTTTTQGGQFTLRSLGHLLRSPRIAGLVRHGGKLYKGQWEPIVDRQTWEDLGTLLDERAAEYGYHGRVRKYLLGGIAMCTGCGKTMRARPTGGRNRHESRCYHCHTPGCPRPVGRNVYHLDAYVTGRVLRRLNEPGFLDEVYAGRADPELAKKITALERRRDAVKGQLRSLADHDDLDVTDAVQGLADLERRLGELRDRRAADARQRRLARMAGIDQATWDAAPLDIRAETVRALFDVVVLPTSRRGPGFDPTAVRVTRKDITAPAS